MANIFQRKESKYLLSDNTYNDFMPSLLEYMRVDEYGKETICNLYFDNQADQVMQRSTSKPVFKEKLRMRSYGTPSANDLVYIELKKKYKGVVYKRRITLPLSQANDFVFEGKLPEEQTQIFKEIDFYKTHYGVQPNVFLAYERVALYCKTQPLLRMTFDDNLRYRFDDLRLEAGDHGRLLGDQHFYILEIKALGAYPMWLVELIRKHKILPVSFSKVGRIFEYKYSQMRSET